MYTCPRTPARTRTHPHTHTHAPRWVPVQAPDASQSPLFLPCISSFSPACSCPPPSRPQGRWPESEGLGDLSGKRIRWEFEEGVDAAFLSTGENKQPRRFVKHELIGGLVTAAGRYECQGKHCPQDGSLYYVVSSLGSSVVQATCYWQGTATSFEMSNTADAPAVWEV